LRANETGATTVGIARRARTTQPLVHHHFGSKAELFVLFDARRPELARIWVIESAQRGELVRRIVENHVMPLMRSILPRISREVRGRLDPAMVIYAIQGIVTYPFLVPEQVKRATGADVSAPAFARAYADVVEALLAPSWRKSWSPRP
jgi:AcrR family transcriptional regulator